MTQDLINQILKACEEVAKTLSDDLRPFALRKIESARSAGTLQAAYRAGSDIEHLAENPGPIDLFLVSPDLDDPSKKISFGYSVAVLEAAFEKVSDPEDWKAPIAASVPGELVSVVTAAIKFYTATVPTVSLDTRTMEYLITSEGYRMGPAGDH